MLEIIKAQEHTLKIEGERSDIEYLVELLRRENPEGTVGDLLYQLELQVDEELRKSVEEDA